MIFAAEHLGLTPQRSLETPGVTDSGFGPPVLLKRLIIREFIQFPSSWKHSMINRRLVSKKDYDRLIRTYKVDKSLFDTEMEKEIWRRYDDLVDEIWRRIKSRELSTDDDIYVLFSFNRWKRVCLNFANDNQVAAEEIALNLLQQPQWSDFAVELCPAYDERMILDGEIEAITKDEIVVQAKESTQIGESS